MANIVPRPGRRERNVKRTAPALRQDPGLDIPACLSQLEEAALQGAPGSARTLTNSQLGVTIGTEDHTAGSEIQRLVKLAACGRTESESLGTYAAALRLYTLGGYPTFNDSQQEELALLGLQPERLYINPWPLSAALKEAELVDRTDGPDERQEVAAVDRCWSSSPPSVLAGHLINDTTFVFVMHCMCIEKRIQCFL